MSVILTGYAKIYKSSFNGESVIIKESKKHNIIFYESLIYQKIDNKCQNIPLFYKYEKLAKFSRLIIQNTGISLDKIKDFNIYSIFKLYSDINKSLAFLHSINIIHGDLKPGNITYNQQENKYYLIDFNLATDDLNKYKVSNRYFLGNKEFSSLNVYKGRNPGYKDDYISLIYVCLYLYTGKLPWKLTDEKFKLSNAEIKQFYKKDDRLIEFLLSKL